ncbi:MAG: hypothetical protein HFJ57_00540 [Clostridia bacterium]|nr:hypothetical protein [Clostridia bacterium]
MKKKVGIIILIISVIILAVIGVLMFTGIGGEIRSFIYYKIHTPQEITSLDKQEHIKVTYTYRWQEENFSIDVTDTELIKLIENNISNKKLDNYSSQIGLAIMGEYNVKLGNDISFEFDSYDDDGFVMINDKDKHFLTKINPEILKRIIEIVDVKLTENIQIFKTDKITVTKRIMQENKASVLNEYKVDIEEKTAIDYILEQCKNIYTEDINYELSIVSPDYELDFNNNLKLLIYKENQKGFMIKDGFLLRAYGLNSFDTILENTFDNLETKKQMFTGDKVTIKSPNKSIEITNKDTIEKIVTPLIYSKIYRPDWIENYNITEEYNKGIKIDINDNEFLIPGIRTIGNRYVITKDNKISLCFPLQDIEKYTYELLGIKVEKYTGPMTIGI